MLKSFEVKPIFKIWSNIRIFYVFGEGLLGWTENFSLNAHIANRTEKLFPMRHHHRIILKNITLLILPSTLSDRTSFYSLLYFQLFFWLHHLDRLNSEYMRRFFCFGKKKNLAIKFLFFFQFVFFFISFSIWINFPFALFCQWRWERRPLYIKQRIVFNLFTFFLNNRKKPYKYIRT